MSEEKVEWSDSAEEERIHALWDKHVGHVWKPAMTLPRMDTLNLFTAIYNMTREAGREADKTITDLNGRLEAEITQLRDEVQNLRFALHLAKEEAELLKREVHRLEYVISTLEQEGEDE